VISGSGNLTTLGAINLSATNTYSGTTTINTGILSATTAGALSTGNITVSNGAELDLANVSYTNSPHSH